MNNNHYHLCVFIMAMSLHITHTSISQYTYQNSFRMCNVYVCHLDRQIDREREGQIDRQIDGQMDRWIDGCMDRWMHGQIDAWIDRCMDRQMHG